MPSGSMLPHCRSSAGDGEPSDFFHTCRYELSKAYTESFSVATMVRPRTTSGEAYTAPSSRIDSTRSGDPDGDGGIVVDLPRRSGVPWYVGQSAPVEAAGVDVPPAGAVAGGVAFGAAGPPPHPASSDRPSSSAAAPAGRFRISPVCHRPAAGPVRAASDRDDLDRRG